MSEAWVELPEGRGHPADRRTTDQRSFVVVDFENLLFGEHETTSHDLLEARARDILTAAHGQRPGDHLLVGCNPRLAFAARAAFPGARLVVGSGADGADKALLRAIDGEVIVRRFGELNIVSGDHIFAELAHRSRARGVPVRVVAPRNGLATRLRLVADVATVLSPPESSNSIAAAA